MPHSRIVRFIGDVHGYHREYKALLRNIPESVQVGDMGVGFPDNKEQGFSTFAVPGVHRFIRGNHDNPSVAKSMSNYIYDGCREAGVMYVGGALSIDRRFRTSETWWEDEQLSHEELWALCKKYKEYGPAVMVTHDCPESIVGSLFDDYNHGYKDPSRTRNGFEEYFNMHQPKLWIFGHWHRSVRKTINGTTFICLAELETLDIDLGEYT